MKQRDKDRSKSWLLPGGITTIIALWLISGQFGENDVEPTSTELATGSDRHDAVRVRTQTAQMVQRTITINGKTAPARVVSIAAETDGRVTAIGAARGANIKRGHTIVRLDERDRSARIAQAEATVQQRQLEYDGRVKLKSESYVSEAQLQEAVALLEAAKAELVRANLDRDYMVVRAPFDGALQSRDVEVGDFVKVGDPIASFVDNRKIIVSANLSEFDAQYVNVDDDAEATLATGEIVDGRIRYVAPVADEATRTFVVELEIDNSDGALRIGGTAVMRVPAEKVLAHKIAPSLLTLDDAGNVGIKMIGNDGEVVFVLADIALSSNDGVWLAGLPETATIITVGQGYVAAGTIVDTTPEADSKTAIAIKTDIEMNDQ